MLFEFLDAEVGLLLVVFFLQAVELDVAISARLSTGCFGSAFLTVGRQIIFSQDIEAYVSLFVVGEVFQLLQGFFKRKRLWGQGKAWPRILDPDVLDFGLFPRFNGYQRNRMRIRFIKTYRLGRTTITGTSVASFQGLRAMNVA